VSTRLQGWKTEETFDGRYGWRIHPCPKRLDQPPSQRLRQIVSQRGKPLRSEADHSPPSSTEIKNEWGYTLSPLYASRRYSFSSSAK